jgi:hypothetical protein
VLDQAQQRIKRNKNAALAAANKSSDKKDSGQAISAP